MPVESKFSQSKWPYGITYEIFVQSFCDSNGDGIGDLNGLTSKLDYIQELGAEAIWLMPINPSPSYHKYDVTDYYGIHPDYGSLQDFKNLLKEAHSRNIKVVMDLVIHHCSKLHPWFIKAMDPSSEYRDYFIWATGEEIKAEGNLIKEQTGDSDNIHQWNGLPGQDELYFGFFWSGMPDLNYDSPKLREEMYKVGEYWLKEIGVDGFRLDAARHIYPDYRAEDTHAFWQKFKARMEAIKPEVYLVGEVWADLLTQTPFAKGFSALFNFDLSFSILETVKNEQVVSATVYKNAWKVNKRGSFLNLYNTSYSSFQAVNPNFLNTTFLTNHDQERVMSFLEDNEDKVRLAATILLTLPGSPYIYYGEELGMRGKKPDELIREPFPWSSNSDTCTTKWMKPKYNVPGKISPLDEQSSDQSSMVNLYKTLIHLRRTNPILTFGDLQPVKFGDRQIMVYRRTFEGKALMIVHNLSAENKSISFHDNFTETEFSTDQAIKYKDDSLVLPAYQSIILSKP